MDDDDGDYQALNSDDLMIHLLLFESHHFIGHIQISKPMFQSQTPHYHPTYQKIVIPKMFSF